MLSIRTKDNDMLFPWHFYDEITCHCTCGEI